MKYIIILAALLFCSCGNMAKKVQCGNQIREEYVLCIEDAKKSLSTEEYEERMISCTKIYKINREYCRTKFVL